MRRGRHPAGRRIPVARLSPPRWTAGLNGSAIRWRGCGGCSAFRTPFLTASMPAVRWVRSRGALRRIQPHRKHRNRCWCEVPRAGRQPSRRSQSLCRRRCRRVLNAYWTKGSRPFRPVRFRSKNRFASPTVSIQVSHKAWGFSLGLSSARRSRLSSCSGSRLPSALKSGSADGSPLTISAPGVGIRPLSA